MTHRDKLRVAVCIKRADIVDSVVSKWPGTTTTRRVLNSKPLKWLGNKMMGTSNTKTPTSTQHQPQSTPQYYPQQGPQYYPRPQQYQPDFLRNPAQGYRHDPYLVNMRPNYYNYAG